MFHSRVEKLFFNALCHSISGKELMEKEFVSLTAHEWRMLYDLSVKQGVLAIVFDAVDSVKQSIPRNIKIQWALGVEQIEKRYSRQDRLAKELSCIFAEYGIKTVALKGMVISRYYPNPAHRECGDFDCFLFDDFEKGNEIAEQLGAEVRFDDYKHSHILYKGLMIENHKYCTPIRGADINKKFENYLQGLLKLTPFEYIKNSTIIAPLATFNALFLARHSLTHFLFEGVNIRHLIDWACLLKYEQRKIQWEEFYRWCELLNMTRFVDLMNCFASDYVGIEISHPRIKSRDCEMEKVVRNILYETNSVYNRPGLSLWQQRWAIVRNMFANHWKFSQIYQKSLIGEYCKALYGVVFERNPKL